MPTTIESIEAEITQAAEAGFRGRLIARGQARAMIWNDGILPPDAPPFSPSLSYDLCGYGYALLGLGLRLRDIKKDAPAAIVAFEQAANALEAAIAKGNKSAPDHSFHLLMAAACYHLAHLSARAYSLLKVIEKDANFSPIEKSLALLMLRKFPLLQNITLSFRVAGVGHDQRIVEKIREGLEAANQDVDQEAESNFLLEGVNLALVDTFFSAIAMFLLALERGERQFLDSALARLQEGQDVCSELGLVPQWWVHRIGRHLLADLWSNTFHEQLPTNTDHNDTAEWNSLRELYIASLLRRECAEVDLWPSQTEAAARSVNQLDDLVVSLPTSAGKTRIAELCILRCLADGRRVIFITPLRALSAQTENSLRRTFSPLGKTVSSLYGSIGVTLADEDTIRENDIVVATPEKLDFALRNAPSLLDDVGLLIFDEGHMIGINEREVRYEVQIQRLLRRSDAWNRRIVCLSAILPDGEQLDDYSNWLRRDMAGGIIKKEWRPTRLRFGEVVWREPTARLNLRVAEERPFIQGFFSGFIPPLFVRPQRARKKLFPDSQRELSLATAWRLVDDGQTVLIYCPERRSVEPFANCIVDLHKRGALASLIGPDEGTLSTAIALGEEWFGTGHPILECLRLGVGIHHGALPTAYRKEVEHLLRKGVLKVTVSSPTLAQGLNLSATAVVFYSLTRNKETIPSSEFKNVIGRAGRAYVDVEGLVVFPMYDNILKRRKRWNELIENVGAKEMESGLILLLINLLKRMWRKVGGDLSEFVEYVTNNTSAWSFPEINGESVSDAEEASLVWERHMATLDTAILSLVGGDDIPDNELETSLTNILQSSLWQRRLLRRNEHEQHVLKTALLSRSRMIWGQSTSAQRRGYFLAGIGLKTGHTLDAIAGDVNLLLVQANGAILIGDGDVAVKTITRIAELVFDISPFKPDVFPENWRTILSCWLLGEPLTSIKNGHEPEVLQFIEGGLVYRLPWAMEAIRVRALANGDTVGPDAHPMEAYELDVAITALETGTINRSVAILIQAGFTTRIGAFKAVMDTQADFTTMQGLRQWLQTETVKEFSIAPDWPTAESSKLWKEFTQHTLPQGTQAWSKQYFLADVSWYGTPPAPGIVTKLFEWEGHQLVVNEEGIPLGYAKHHFNSQRKGLLCASVSKLPSKIDLTYLGPKDLFTQRVR